MPSQICMYVDVLCWLQSANKKAMEIRRGRLNEHSPNVNCYGSRKSFPLAWVPIEFTEPYFE